MLLASRQAAGSVQNLDISGRTLPPSPQRISPRDTFKSADSIPGRSKKLSVAAEPGSATPAPADTVGISSPLSEQAASEEQAEAQAKPSIQQSAALEAAKQLRLHFGTANIPHPDKSDYGGEDAYFVSPVGGGAFGVADGVGGWQDSGINPAEYSRTFMRLACAHLEGKPVHQISPAELAATSATGPVGQPADASLGDALPAESASQPSSMSHLTPQSALAAAHANTRLPGSTTACVMRLDRATNKLSAANLGDSGFLLVRNGAAIFRSPALQHFFDCPLQFAAFPDYTSATDNPEDAGVYELALEPGDVIVAGTDGLWDNIQQEEILELIQVHTSSMPKLAMTLAQSAAAHSNDRKYASPYSQEAVKQGIDIPWILRLATASFSDGKFKLGHLKGGKMDDITVVTALVTEEPVPTPAAEDPVPVTEAVSVEQP